MGGYMKQGRKIKAAVCYETGKPLVMERGEAIRNVVMF
jgi:hypothetical protein